MLALFDVFMIDMIDMTGAYAQKLYNKSSSILSEKALFLILVLTRIMNSKNQAAKLSGVLASLIDNMTCLQGCYNFKELTMLEQKNNNLEHVMALVNKASNKLGTENLAITLMTIANLLWPLSFLYVSQHHFSPFQTNLARGASICITHILVCNYLGINLDFKSSRDIKYLIIRNSLIAIHQIIYTAMHFVLSFPLLNSISITGPLFVFIIDYYLNGITINRTQVIGIVVSFAGILININGDFLMTFIDPDFKINSSFQHYQVTDIRAKILFSLFCILTNVVWGYAIVVQKKIRHLPGIKISFFLGIQFVFSSGLTSCFGKVQPVTFHEFFWACLLSGLVMACCQILFISSLNLTKNTGKMTMLMLLYGVTSYSISFFKFGEEINAICLGGLIIAGYGLYKTIFGATS